MDNQIILDALKQGAKDISLYNTLISQLASEIEILKEKSETWDRVTTSPDAIEMSAVAKKLNYKKIGRNKLFAILKELKVLRHNCEPYQEHIDAGRFRVIAQEFHTPRGVCIGSKTLVTPKGIDYMRKIVDKYIGIK